MTALDDLRAARSGIEGAGVGTDMLEIADPIAISQALQSAIGDAVGVPSPPGNPDEIANLARNCQQAADRYEQASGDLRQIANGHLPSIWQGATAKMASDAIDRLGGQVGGLQHPLRQAATALSQWSEDLAAAKSRDGSGVLRLNDAMGMVQHTGLVAQALDQLNPARKIALEGVNARISAAQYVQEGAEKTSAVLRKLCSQTAQEHVGGPGEALLSSAELADLKGPNGSLLSPNQLALASARLEAMSPSDQAAFEQLLAKASPLEAGYLYQALSCGYGAKDLATFANMIGQYSNDPASLMSLLTPDLSTDKYKGEGFSQGNVNDCVAASTVIAQAKIDPVYMLGLTTGFTTYNEPHGDGNGDSGAAFQSRLQADYLNQYGNGQVADGDPESSGGIYAKGETMLANQQLGSTTGSHYHYQSLDSSSARASVLGQINQAVGSGKPVPIDVSTGVPGSEGHQMMIIGQHGDKLQIYNPWGHTTWVSSSQFVNGQLGSLTNYGAGGQTDSGLPIANAVELPQ